MASWLRRQNASAVYDRRPLSSPGSSCCSKTIVWLRVTGETLASGQVWTVLGHEGQTRTMGKTESLSLERSAELEVVPAGLQDVRNDFPLEYSNAACFVAQKCTSFFFLPILTSISRLSRRQMLGHRNQHFGKITRRAEKVEGHSG